MRTRKNKARFIQCAAKTSQYPTGDSKEIAFLGRSNAGKSSLLNAIMGDKLAKVSGTPGKTQLICFYEMPRYRLVDLPGYGYAARPAKEIRAWQTMIEDYLATRGSLVASVLVMDIRRNWQKEEEQLRLWLKERQLPMVLALSKADKISKNQNFSKVAKMKKENQLDYVFSYSSLKKSGVDELEEFLFREFIAGEQ